ncbi:hypothetical protein DSCW_19790 [Desulfosarcina widdelii]|uniref:Uncharacterized protein n=1 Tax=Desulfosarcina widdelii TaxID=947919 RepID=A0A5K7YXQ7_9BACT|nr:hypothetical protein [Desulfosarcina widdelii]BBO74562.1 hypothetical protein DSCW_19790 [Desulfosarcina widdelii]
MKIEQTTVPPTVDACQLTCPQAKVTLAPTETDSRSRVPIIGKDDDGGRPTAIHPGELCAKFREERSLFGYTPHVLKSGIQKYGRRNKLMNGLWCLVEMDLFSLLEWDGPTLEAYLKEHPGESRINVQRSAQRLRTNMANRLVVMMSEEVSISAWWMPIKMLDLYQKWWATRDTPESRKHLVDIYRYLLSQRMIRLISDLHSVYLIPPDYVKPKQMNDLVRIHRGIKTLHPALYTDQSSVGEIDWDLDDYPANLRPCIEGIVYNLEAGSDHVFFWINQLCDRERRDGVGEYQYLKAVWSVLHRFIDRHPGQEFVRESISALEWFFKKMTHQEKPIYLYHAILLLVRRQQIDWEAKAPHIDTPIAEVESLYAFHLAGRKRPMDDYILDLHTRRGKRSGNCLENFAMEGAYIERENVDFLRPEYREIYVTLKQELDLYRNKGLEEQQKRWPLRKLACRVGVPIQSLSSTAMARIKKAPHAKLKTAVYKKPVHIVGDLVYKGPYTFDVPRFINNLRFTYALQVLEERLSLPEWLRASLPWQCIDYDGNDGYFLAAPNVGKTGSIPFKIASSKLEANVPVVTKGGCVRRVADIESNGQMTNEAKRIVLQHLYFRFLLGIGDSGTHQILIREDYKTSGRFLAGVDIEERRGVKENGSRLDHLFKKAPSKFQRSMYAPVVDQIRAIGHHHLDPDTLGRLSAVGIDPESVKKNIGVWEGLKPF